MVQQRRGSRLLLLLFAIPIVFTGLSIWTAEQVRTPLRGMRTEGVPTNRQTHVQISHTATEIVSNPADLYSLVRQRQSTVTSKPEFLHLDDLARSESYEQWAPVIVSKCMHGMDKLTAPCIKEARHTNLIEAQELYYPAFRLKLPTFASTSMEDKWVAKGLHLDRMRVTEDKQWAEYAAFQGQNMVFENAVFRGDPPADTWSDKSCMGRAVSHLSFQHDANDSSSDASIGTLIIATSPDSWSFQHFIDRVAVVWSQAQLVVPTTKKADTVVVSGRKPRDSIVNEIYELMVGSHMHRPGTIAAKKLVFSCRAPLIHPFTTQRITENILQALPAPKSDEGGGRNVILFLSRSSKGGKAANGGRRVMNEDALFDAVAAMLKAEGRPEKVRYFRHSDFTGLNQVASFMRDRVKMMIGPHGAAFYNSRFAQPRTSVVEIIPDSNSFFVPCFWEQARLLGQDYAAHVAKVVSSRNDMEVDDVPELVELVRNRLKYLDKSFQKADALEYKYAWDVGTKIV